MEVKFVRSGGFMGLDMVATVDSADLPPDQQAVVSRLLTEDLRDSAANRPGGADQFSYELEIHHGDRMVTRHWDEPEVQDTVRPLLSGLSKAAKPVR
jgi:hypothetical protein